MQFAFKFEKRKCDGREACSYSINRADDAREPNQEDREECQRLSLLRLARRRDRRARLNCRFAPRKNCRAEKDLRSADRRRFWNFKSKSDARSDEARRRSRGWQPACRSYRQAWPQTGKG